MKSSYRKQNKNKLLRWNEIPRREDLFEGNMLQLPSFLHVCRSFCKQAQFLRFLAFDLEE